jgi:hypothetical protein
MILQISNSEQFERLLDSLAADVLDAGYHLQLRTALLRAAEEYREEFAEQRTFWHLTLSAQESAVMAHLFRAYDQSQDSLSLLNLIDTIRDNAHLFGSKTAGHHPAVVNPEAMRPDSAALQQDRHSVSPKDPLVAKLVGLRGNFFSQRGVKRTVDSLGLDARFAMASTDLEELWRRGLSIINRYSQLFRHGVWSTTLVGQEDYKALLDALRRDREQRKVLRS